jgi:hypothetical protein
LPLCCVCGVWIDPPPGTGTDSSSSGSSSGMSRREAAACNSAQRGGGVLAHVCTDAPKQPQKCQQQEVLGVQHPGDHATALSLLFASLIQNISSLVFHNPLTACSKR